MQRKEKFTGGRIQRMQIITPGERRENSFSARKFFTDHSRNGLSPYRRINPFPLYRTGGTNGKVDIR